MRAAVCATLFLVGQPVFLIILWVVEVTVQLFLCHPRHVFQRDIDQLDLRLFELRFQTVDLLDDIGVFFSQQGIVFQGVVQSFDGRADQTRLVLLRGRGRRHGLLDRDDGQTYAGQDRAGSLGALAGLRGEDGAAKSGTGRGHVVICPRIFGLFYLFVQLDEGIFQL